MAKDRKGKDKKGKHKKQEKAVKGGKKGAKKHKPNLEVREHGAPVWSEALAIQVLARSIEIEALERYMTEPERVDRVREALLKALDMLRRDPAFGCGGRPCPSGFHCCDNVCRAEPCDVSPNPPKPPKRLTDRL